MSKKTYLLKSKETVTVRGIKSSSGTYYLSDIVAKASP